MMEKHWSGRRRDFTFDVRPKRTPDARCAALLATAACLGGLAIVNHLLVARAEAANPPQGKFLEVDGQRLHYLDEGEGQAIVLLHGNGSMSNDFVLSGLVEALSSNARVIVFDRPGFGYSPPRSGSSPKSQADLIAAALVKLGVEEATVVGHSWGTLVALALTGGPRIHVTNLVLISGFYLSSRRLALAAGSIAAVPILGQLLSHTVLPWVSRLSWPVLVRKLFAPQTSRFFREFPSELTFRPSQIHASARETALLNPSVSGLFKRISGLNVPITVIAGANDEIVDPIHSQQFRRKLPGAAVEIIPNQGHMLHHTAMDHIAGVIADLQRKPSSECR